MSSYNSSMFIGFAACFPRVLPKWLYTRLFCPPQPSVNGIARFAPCGLRKIEAALIDSGIPREDIGVAAPDRLHEVIDSKTKVVGVTTSDPMGLGPASSTFSSLLRKETYTAYFFRNLMMDPCLKSSHAKLIVGGPGAWQLANESDRTLFGIDTLVEGEGEMLAPQLFKDALEGRPLPSKVAGGVVPIDRIPSIKGGTINGTVEISRGCGRGCEFCNPNMRQVRHMPISKIVEEIRVNVKAGTGGATLHAEDILRYGAKGMIPEKDKVIELFEEVLKVTNGIGISHLALSSALAQPRLIEELGVLTRANTRSTHIYGQTGIETGSPELVSKHMKGKAKPFKPEQWPEVVTEGFKLLYENKWVPCGTLVMGMPGERAEDVTMTHELIANLRQYKSLIVPLFFVPLGELKDNEFFRPHAMLPEHWMLLAECIEHDFHWVPIMMEELFAQDRMSSPKSGAMKLASWYMRHRVKPYLELMKEGKNPMKHTEPEPDSNGLSRTPLERAEA